MQISLLRRLVGYGRPYVAMYVLVLSCSLVASSTALAFPLLVRHVTNEVLAGSLTTALVRVYRIGLLMLALIVVQALATYVVDYKGHEIGARMEGKMRRDLFKHIQTLPFEFFDGTTTGQLTSRITNDLLDVSELCHHGPEDYLNYLIRFGGSVTILCFINARLTTVVLCFLPLLLAFVLHFNRRLNTEIRETRQRIAEINAQAEDSLAGIRVVQAFTNECTEVKKFEARNERFLQDRKHVYRAQAYFSEVGDALVQLMLVAVVTLGSAAIIHATLHLSDLIAFLLYIGFMTAPIQKVMHMSTQFQEGITGFQRCMEIMDVRPDIQSKPGAILLSESRRDSEIEFCNVSFRYADKPDYVLRHLSCRIGRGEYVALVGPSGIGKTTMCSLIPRFYDTAEGAVLLDGVDVRDIDLGSLRRNIGVVQQDVYLFAGSVLENVRYGRESATEKEVVDAAKSANAHEFILNLPRGYESEIGQRGIKLSAGQRQRLTIARLFLKDPAILILDEATSALDNESESVVQASLERLAQRRTTIVIAHRLSTIRNAGRILVMGSSGIVEEGTHKALLATGGVYANLYARQFDL